MNKKVKHTIDEIDKRILLLKNKDNTNNSNKDLSLLSVGTQVCIELVSGIIVGAGIGYILNELFDFGRVFLICMVILGGFAGFLNITRYLKSIEKDKVER